MQNIAMWFAHLFQHSQLVLTVLACAGPTCKDPWRSFIMHPSCASIAVPVTQSVTDAHYNIDVKWTQLILICSTHIVILGRIIAYNWSGYDSLVQPTRPYLMTQRPCSSDRQVYNDTMINITASTLTRDVWCFYPTLPLTWGLYFRFTASWNSRCSLCLAHCCNNPNVSFD